jgi:hypothetical protein
MQNKTTVRPDATGFEVASLLFLDRRRIGG